MVEWKDLNVQAVQQAAQRLAGQAVRTPVLRSAAIDERAGAQVFFKCENLQRVGAFKFRGAYNAIAALDEVQRARGVVAFSSGNHAQAVALAAKLFGIAATIVMPKDAPAIKKNNVLGYGARVVSYDRLTEDREVIAATLAQEQGATIIPPFAHPDVIAGQGTAALELFSEVGPLDALFVPLGGGGLLSGSLLAQQGLAPECAVYGVEPQAGDDGQQSFRAGVIHTIEPPQSIADGALTQALAPITFALIRQYARDVLTVSDDALVQALQCVANNLKLVIEPTAALGLAAVLQRQTPHVGQRIGVILSGGNVDPAAFARYLVQ